VLFSTWPVPARAEDQAPTKLDISILEGEGAINNIHQRVAREAMIQVNDENHKPVAGATVSFFLPEHGAGGLFSNGTHSLTVMTDNTGRAVAQGILPNKVPGQVQIRVVARLKTLNANIIIHQQNVAAIAAGATTAGVVSAKVLAIILVAAAATAGGVVAATRSGSSPSPTPTPTVTITVGTPTVGAPH
jgi:hypothetical protein